jgi:hypothetical protein
MTYYGNVQEAREVLSSLLAVQTIPECQNGVENGRKHLKTSMFGELVNSLPSTCTNTEASPYVYAVLKAGFCTPASRAAAAPAACNTVYYLRGPLQVTCRSSTLRAVVLLLM